jgi:alkanesulfonate monooxygenase SsuD/methylene tetrahydromethanopterin reductase-like flavin-dependent oxidoreductase (luciferase family)
MSSSPGEGDPAAVEYSWDGHVVCTRAEDTKDRLLDLMTPIQIEDEYFDDRSIVTEGDARQFFLVGEPEECAAAIQIPETRGMELFADEVMPEFA